MRRLALCLLLAGCGGTRPPAAALPDPTEALPAYGEPALQLYLVLTADAAAMQGKPAVDAMWKAVNGEGARYAPIRQRVQWVPGDYQVDVALDFADLPHPAFSAQKLGPMLADLPPAVRAQAEEAKLAVVVRSATTTLPRGDHIRLAGLAALYAADSSDGVILDLLARRAWTRDAWAAELGAERLGPDQVRLTSRADGADRWLLTRGNPKYGAPDLQMRGVKAADVPAARARFAAVQRALVERGGRPGDVIAGETLGPCDAPKGLHDAACVQIPAP